MPPNANEREIKARDDVHEQNVMRRNRKEKKTSRYIMTGNQRDGKMTHDLCQCCKKKHELYTQSGTDRQHIQHNKLSFPLCL